MSVYNALKYNVSFANAGSLVLLTTNTASSSSSLSFTTKIDSTYSEYIFLFNNIHPATDGADFTFNFSTDSGSNYNVTKTSSFFRAYHYESDASGLGYDGGGDLAQSTGYQVLYQAIGNDNDQSGAGFLHLFDPSNTTFVKHYIANKQFYGNGDFSMNTFLGGYGNTTSAIDAIDFKMSSGNIDSGTIQMFGVVK
mgnify:FL=1